MAKYVFKPIPSCFKSAILEACNASKITLEAWDIQHSATLSAERGKLEATGTKLGIFSVGKDCKTGKEGQNSSFNVGGKLAHPSIKFYRECIAATPYHTEFPDASIGLTEQSKAYVKSVAERVVELAKGTKAEKPGIPQNA